MIKRLKDYIYRIRNKNKNWYFKFILKKPYYIGIDKSILILNFIAQRIFRLNANVPFSVHFTSDVGGFNNIKFIGNPHEMIISFLASGNCYYNIVAGTVLEIGEDTMWAHGVTFTTGNHGLINRNDYTKDNIKIGKNCWLASNVCMLPGSEIGDNVTVAANAVVTKKFPSNCVIGGVPAKIIKSIQ